MSTAIFIRLLGESDKGAGLLRSVEDIRRGNWPEGVVYAVDPVAFREVPETPFAYWVSDRIRRLFSELPSFEGEGRTARQGLVTADYFRFVRAWWEVSPERILDAANGPSWRSGLAQFQGWCQRQTSEGKRWVPLAKGGEYSPYYSDIHLVVNWEGEGAEVKEHIIQRYPYLKGKWGWVAKNTDYYFRPGLTWPERTTSGYCPQVMPAGLIFTDKGQAMFLDEGHLLPALLAAHSTRVFEYLEELMIGLGEETVSGSAARDYTSGTLGRLPFPEELLLDHEAEFSSAAGGITVQRRRTYAMDEASLAFSLGYFFVGNIRSSALREQRERLVDWHEQLQRTAGIERAVRNGLGLSAPEISEIASVVGPHPVLDLPSNNAGDLKGELERALDESIDVLIDDAVAKGLASRSVTKKSYFVSRFHELLAQRLGCSAVSILEAHQELGKLRPSELDECARRLASVLVGLTFGRWDIRMARDPGLLPTLPDPFDPLPISPPATLISPQGIPAQASMIASEEWLRARPDASRLPPPGGVGDPIIPVGSYDVEIPWDGILVDDPGVEGEGPAREDFLRLLRAALEAVYGENARELENELADLLGVRELRDYFARPMGFFADHLTRYSRSRRKAPIYWPLSTDSGSYTVWVYYPRLTADTLFRVVSEQVEPKLTRAEQRIAKLAGQPRESEGPEAGRLAKQVGELVAFRDELQELREELLRVAQLPYRPNLDDGVQITAAPLWRLFRHKPWRRVLEETWAKLEQGNYDWSRLAYAIWPERVREKCRSDRSLAVAQGLQDIYEGGRTPEHGRRRRRKTKGKEG